MADDERPAHPDRYMVRRVGTQDPERSVYYVLDLVYDLNARSVLRGLVRRYRLHDSSYEADKLESLLDATEEDFVAVIREREERLQVKKTPARRAAPRRRTR